MKLTSLARRLWVDRTGGAYAGDRVDDPQARGALASGLLPDEATIGRLRQFSFKHGLRPVDGLVGEHRSRRRGAAPEFSDYSPYTPGDDVRRIDWNAYARFDTLYVRESEITTELDVHFLVDLSASMNWSGSPQRQSKVEMARRVATMLAWLALSRSDRVTVTGVADELGESFGPLQGRGMVVPFAMHLTDCAANGSGLITDAMQRYARRRSRSGLLLVLTDLIGVTAAELDRSLSTLANERWQVVLMQVEDPTEIDPATLSAPQDVFELEDPESGMRQRVNLHPDIVRRHREGRENWLYELDVVARRRSAPLIRVATDARLDPDVLLALERAHVIVS